MYYISSSSLFYLIPECVNELISAHICVLSLLLGSYPSVFFILSQHVFISPYYTIFFLKKDYFLPWKPVCFLMTDGGVFGWERRWEGTEKRKGGVCNRDILQKAKTNFH